MIDSVRKGAIHGTIAAFILLAVLGWAGSAQAWETDDIVVPVDEEGNCPTEPPQELKANGCSFSREPEKQDDQCRLHITCPDPTGSSSGGTSSGGGSWESILQQIAQVLQSMGSQGSTGLANGVVQTQCPPVTKSENDPRYCSVVIMAPCPTVVKVGKNPVGTCPDVYVDTNGAIQKVGPQISPIISQILQGIIGGILPLLGGGSSTSASSSTGSSSGGECDPIARILGECGGSSSTSSSSSSSTSSSGSTSASGSSSTSASGSSSTSSTSSGSPTTTVEGSLRSSSGRAGEGNSVSNFFGAVGGNLLGELCTSRPWASGVLSFLPNSFFDNTCARFGYATGFGGGNTTTFTPEVMRGISCTPETVQPGDPVTLSWSCGAARLAGVAGFTLQDKNATSVRVTPTADSTVYGIRCSDGFESLCTVQKAKPELTIWTDPSDIRLGTRATVYWVTRGVESCTVNGPSFTEVGVQGGAQTVPITTASTYTLTCRAADGSVHTARTTLDLAI